MLTREQALSIVQSAISELNEMRGPSAQMPLETTTVLQGVHSGLDSLGLINLIAAVEDKAKDVCGKSVYLGVDESTTGSENPFSTIETLAEELVKRAAN